MDSATQKAGAADKNLNSSPEETPTEINIDIDNNGGPSPEFKPLPLGNLSQILIMPFYTIGIDSLFMVFYYLAVACASDKAKINAIMRYGSEIKFNWIAFGFVFMLVMTIIWFIPLWRFSKYPTAANREAARKKIAFIYRDLYSIFIMVFAAKLAAHLVIYKQFIIWEYFFKYNMPAMILSVVMQFCFAAVFLDTLIFSSAGDYIGSLYDEDELYKPKQGYSISIAVKIIMLFFSTAVIPLLLLYLFIVNNFTLEEATASNVFNLVTVGALTPMIIGIAFIVRNIQKPIDELSQKMKKLSEGDFSVRSRIYFTDEIASIKAHFNVMTAQLSEREKLRETFGKYVSIEVARELLKSGGIGPGGEEIEATVLFCDIRNFTSISERISARQLVEMLNSYFSFITAPAALYNGVVNKFIGDAVMVIYLPRLGSRDHVSDAVLSAVKMREALCDFNKNGVKPAGDIKFGIGIHTGTLIAGSIGTKSRLEYTVIGDTVNIASRIESKTKDYQTDILITANVYKKISPAVFENIKFEKAGETILKGKDKPVEVYRVL
jgi:adenylate cyclase